jgi:chromosome segregation ATPase
VVAKLVEQQGDLQKVNAELRARLAERDTQVRALEERLRTANQLRQDVAKRIDELIGQIDQLDAELEESES